ncbi:MAG: stage III sporulation protein AB [Ruminiclostridium sp.]|nr:stage III sporulation protein AB [Ruminiclostridium sp.]
MAGFAFSRRLTERIENIRQIQVFLMDLENEILYISRPIGQALLSISAKKGMMSLFAKRVSEIQRNKELSINKAWEEILNEFRDQWVLDQEEWELLLSLGDVLGKTDKAGQKSYIELVRDKFCLQEKKAENDRAQKEKLYKSLGVLGGLATVLVLI